MSLAANLFRLIPAHSCTCSRWAVLFIGRQPLFAGTAAAKPAQAESADTFLRPPAASSDPLADRARELDERERKLKERELQAERTNAAALSKGVTGGKINNFPPFFPVTYHSIEDDIPPHQRKTMRLLLTNFFLTVIGLFSNWLALTALWLGVSPFLWSAIYAVVGTWGAWNGWYRSAYKGFKNNSSTSFFCFFIVFAVHCGFSVFVTVGLSYDSTAVCGVLTLVDCKCAATRNPP